MNLQVRTPAHARNRGGPKPGTFGSNKPAANGGNMLNKSENMVHVTDR